MARFGALTGCDASGRLGSASSRRIQVRHERRHERALGPRCSPQPRSPQRRVRHAARRGARTCARLADGTRRTSDPGDGDGRGRQGGARRPAPRRRRRSARCPRRTRNGCRAGTHRDAIAALLRVGDRGNLSDRARRGLAGRRLGPGLRHAHRHDRCRRHGGDRRRMVARSARPARERGRRLRHRCDDGELRGSCRCSCAPARRGRLGCQHAWSHRCPAGPAHRRGGTPWRDRPCSALSRPRRRDARRERRAGTHPRRPAPGRARVRRRVDDRGAAGGKRALGRVRRLPGGDRGRACGRRVGARRRRVRSLGGGIAAVPAPCRGLRAGRFLGDRCPQDAQRSVRLRRRDRRGPEVGADRARYPRELPRSGAGRARSIRQDAGVVPAGARRAGLGDPAVARALRRRRARRWTRGCRSGARGGARRDTGCQHRERRRLHAGVRGHGGRFANGGRHCTSRRGRCRVRVPVDRGTTVRCCASP